MRHLVNIFYAMKQPDLENNMQLLQFYQKNIKFAPSKNNIYYEERHPSEGLPQCCVQRHV
jgi:hypothetical protein